MPFQTEEGIGAIHAAPIIGHTYHACTPALKLDSDPTRAGIDGVLDKFLDHGSGPLHDLAGSNLTGKGVGEESDQSHRKERLERF